MMKKVLSIAGSDCSGGAGIQADLKTFSAHGVFGMSVITAVVAENTSRVIALQEVEADIISAQIDAIYEDIGTDAVKIGMLPAEKSMKAVADKIREYHPANIVIDPVMYAKNGCPLMEEEAIHGLVEMIIPLADVLTPNIPEAEKIAGMSILNREDMKAAAAKIFGMGCRAVVVKGGHLSSTALDILYDGKDYYEFGAARIPTINTHGTGCTFSSAIAASMAAGYAPGEAVKRAKSYVTAAIEHSLELGKGNGPTHHFYELYRSGLRAALQKEGK